MEDWYFKKYDVHVFPGARFRGGGVAVPTKGRHRGPLIPEHQAGAMAFLDRERKGEG